MRSARSMIIRRIGLSLVALVLAVGPVAIPQSAVASAPPPAPLAAVAAAADAAPLLADAEDLQDFDIASMDVDYALTREADGTSRALVVEEIVAVFPDRDQNRGLQRRIPTTYQGVPTFPTLLSVTDGQGAAREYDTDTDDGALVITAAGEEFVRGEQTYVLTYELQNVVTNFRDTDADEFYWDVNGVDWQQPFGSVTARVRVDGAVADALTGEAACYRGAEGATDQCQISDAAGDGSGAVIEASTGDLAPSETMTIAIGFDTGTFEKFDTSFAASPWAWAQGAAAALGLGIVGVAAAVRSRRLRDEPGRPTIIAEYTPPADLDALESAMLLGRTSKAIPAEVLEQAVVGSIRIVEVPKQGRFGSAKLQAHLVDASLADGDGRMLLEGLFGEGALTSASQYGDTVYEFGSTDTRLSKAAQKILAAATADLKARGMRREVPAAAIGWTIALAVLAAIAGVVFGALALGNGVAGPVPLTLILVSIATGLTALVLVSRTPLTARGAEARDHLAGLKMFIEWAEADRIRMLQSPEGAERVPVDTDDRAQMLVLYERLLPYAVVFGQEKQWSERLAMLYGDGGSPGWYAGTSSFNAAAFSAGISTLSTSSASSTSGGSTGGGSAGGGGGGGGGGGV